MESVKKFIKTIIYSIFTKFIVYLCTIVVVSLVGFWNYYQQAEINKLKSHFGSNHKDVVVNLTINSNELHKNLLKILKDNCNDGVYLSYFSSDDQRGTWIALVSNHQILSEQAKFIAAHLESLTKDTVQLEALHNLSNLAFLAENVIKRQDFNPIYTETYDFTLGGIDPTSQAYFYNIPSFKPKIISQEEIESYNFLRHIFKNMMLGKYNISSESIVYIYSLYTPKVNRIRFMTLFFTNTKNNCLVQTKMQEIFNNSYQVLNTFNV